MCAPPHRVVCNVMPVVTDAPHKPAPQAANRAASLDFPAPLTLGNQNDIVYSQCVPQLQSWGWKPLGNMLHRTLAVPSLVHVTPAAEALWAMPFCSKRCPQYKNVNW